MELHFTKMQGAGNDFVMLDGIAQRLDLTPERLRRMADRRYGVGADQILVVEAAPAADVDFRYRIFNADGAEVEQCGNGARCFVKFVRDRGLTRKRTVRVLTAGGTLELRLEDDGDVSVDMGAPDFDPAAAGMNTSGLQGRRLGNAWFWPLAAGGATMEVCAVSLGNPHAVQFVADVDHVAVATLGPAIERHERFARGVNAGFAQIQDRRNLRLRVWERGTGETLACGSGACAAAAAGIRMGLLDSPVRVHARGGRLLVSWSDAPAAPAPSHVTLSGPAEKVYEGRIELT
jgi:diaminopimelate epimerase